MAFPQFEVMSTTTEMDIASTLSGTTARNVLHLTVTDGGTQTSGISSAIAIDYTKSGAGAGGETNPLAINTTISAACGYTSCITLYTAAVSNHAVSGVWGIDCYMEDTGTGATYSAGLNLGKVCTNKATAEYFIRCRNHGATSMDAILRFEASNSATYVLSQGGAGLPYSSGNPSVQDGKWAVDYNGATKYIALYSS